MSVSLESLMSILMTSWPIMVEMIDLVNSVSILLCQISSDTSIFSTVAFPASYSDHVVVSFSIHCKLRKGCYSSLHSFWLFSCWFIWFLWSFEKCSRGGYLYIDASAAATEFCEWVLVGVAVYIPSHKYHVKPYSSPWFTAALATVIAHRNHVFHLYQ